MHINILQYFETTVKKNQKKNALKEGDNTLDFRTLQVRAKCLAALIKSSINRRLNVPVAVFLPKSIDCITADIATMYTGNIFMNLDVKAPQSRILNIINAIKPKIILSKTEFLSLLPIFSDDIIIIDLNNIDSAILTSNEDLLSELLETFIDTDPLCIINTSGSTGTPKGVVLNHRSYINYTTWAISTFKINNRNKLGVLSPPFFDHFHYEICLMMMIGVELILIDNKMASFPLKLLELLASEKINYIFWVPTIMTNIANMGILGKVNLSAIKLVWFAGEVFPTKQFKMWKSYLPSAIFVNLYGPTECTVDCTYYIVNRDLRDDESIPIGYPCRNTDILILNERNELIKSDEEGELCVRGTSLAMGYYNNSEKTAFGFVQNPLNKSYNELIYRTGDVVGFNNFGEIVFKGRKDTLIKHLGYRIELGEIEHVIINVLKMVNNCCIVYRVNKKEIIVFYESNVDIDHAEFRKRLLQQLPKYMIPSKYIRMDELPRNTNGKIDRLFLKNYVNEA